MDKHVQALLDGLATGLGFVGVMGFAIDSSKWPILSVLIALAAVLPIVTRLKENNE